MNPPFLPSSPPPLPPPPQGFKLDSSELREYGHGLFSCIAKSLAADFAPFLPHCVPLALESIAQVCVCVCVCVCACVCVWNQRGDGESCKCQLKGWGIGMCQEGDKKAGSKPRVIANVCVWALHLAHHHHHHHHRRSPAGRWRVR